MDVMSDCEFVLGYVHEHTDFCERVRRVAASGWHKALEAAAKEAEAGGCECHFAPCPHDETGKRIAFLIRRLAATPEALQT
jgi:hypothetical protein